MSELSTTYATIFSKLQKGCVELSPEEIQRLIPCLESCMEMIVSEALFSKNEEVDDIPTESLKVRCSFFIYYVSLFPYIYLRIIFVANFSVEM